MQNMFEANGAAHYLQRINQLNTSTQAQWGTMNVAQMLAHLNVAYEMAYEDIHPKPGTVARFFLKLFVKNTVVGDKPYAKNSRTAPQFVISNERDFEKEKQRLIDYINKTQQLGATHFEGRASHSFGALTAKEWNVSFAKHLEHHLGQFGV